MCDLCANPTLTVLCPECGEATRPPRLFHYRGTCVGCTLCVVDQGVRMTDEGRLPQESEL